MKIAQCLVVVACALWEAHGFPYSPYFGNMDTLSYGSSDSGRGGMVLSRYYNPYYNQRAVGGGMAAFMYKPEDQAQQYYSPVRRRQTQPDAYIPPPQQNEVYYPQQPDIPQQPEVPIVTETTEIAEPTEKSETFSTTIKAVSVPELIEPEVEDVEEPVKTPKKSVGAARKKQVKRPVDDDDEEESYPPRMPTGAFFPMFFGYGGRSAGAPGGPTAIANAFSTGRGGVATSHATAYGAPRPDDQKL